MLFDRQKTLLTLLDALGGQAAATDFQKLLFLYTRQEVEASYDFVPYRFGCFSFTSYADKRRLIEKGILENDDQYWRLSRLGSEIMQREAVMPLMAVKFCRQHSGLRGDALIAEVYKRYPYFAIRSEIIEKVLGDSRDRERIERARPKKAAAGLLTIGYEGKTLESYLNQLLRASVTLLCDVRRNPLSRKYGFSKNSLGSACERVGVRYEHLPELGIDSAERRELKTQSDYDALFEAYERNSLPRQTAALEKISDWIQQGERVALTCFELRPHQCHRHCVSAAMERRNRQLNALHL